MGPSTPKKHQGSRKRKRVSPTKTKLKATTAQKAHRANALARKKTKLASGRSGPRLPVIALRADDPALRDPFARARAVLHVSATPQWLPCREDEFAEVEAYLEAAIEEGAGCCIYIGGMPGTGKTATVHSVVDSLKRRAKQGEVAPFKFFEINGMKVTEPNQTYVQLWSFLSDEERSTPRHALSSLDAYFKNPNASGETCVVLVDELDQLLVKNSKNEVIYNFFNWPNQAHSRLIVLAIANKMDMPETDLNSKINSRLGSNRIIFPPYKHEQLQTILEARLEAVSDVFYPDALRMVAKKVASVLGDCRKALDVCRRACEVVEAKNMELKRAGQPTRLVHVSDAVEVYNAMVLSGKSLLLKSMSVHQQTFLIAISKVVKSLGVPEVEVGEVIKRHCQLCTNALGIAPPTHEELFKVLSSLQAFKLVTAESSRLDYFAHVRSEVKDSDLELVVKVDGRFARVLQAN